VNKYIPIGLFILLVAVLGFGLTNDPKKVPSPFIDKPVPPFDTTRLYQVDNISTESMKGKVWLLNVFASWCASCRSEHKLITDFVEQTKIPVIGLNYKDEAADAKKWLAYFGNPYYAVAVDRKGSIGIDLGVYGVPETFVMDKKGIVRYKEVGPVGPESLAKTIIPLVKKLEAE